MRFFLSKLISFTGPVLAIQLALILSIKAEDRFDARSRMGTPINVLVESDPNATSSFERQVGLMELRPAEVDYRAFSGSQTRALLSLPRDVEITAYGLSGFAIATDAIESRFIYLLDKRQRIWRAAMGDNRNGTPRPQLERVPGRFQILQSDGVEYLFAVDDQNRLAILGSATSVDDAVFKERLALPLNAGEKVVKILGNINSGIQVLTNQMRVMLVDVLNEANEEGLAKPLPQLGLSLISTLKLTSTEIGLPFQEAPASEPLNWDMRGNPHEGDFWVLNVATKTVWLKTQADTEGNRTWVSFPFGESELQIMGIDETSLYLRVDSDYMALRRMAPSPRAISKEFLSHEYFSKGLMNHGIMLDLATRLLIMQPSSADRGKGQKRKDLHVRDLSTKRPPSPRFIDRYEIYKLLINSSTKNNVNRLNEALGSQVFGQEEARTRLASLSKSLLHGVFKGPAGYLIPKNDTPPEDRIFHIKPVSTEAIKKTLDEMYKILSDHIASPAEMNFDPLNPCEKILK